MPLSEAPLNMSLISRALTNHDAVTAYTLISEKYPSPDAELILLKLISTVSDWPLEIEPNAVLINTLLNPRNTIILESLLNHRELQILRCSERGLSSLDTAKELILSLHTIRDYRKNIMIKMQTHSMIEAVHIAHEQGLIE